MIEHSARRPWLAEECFHIIHALMVSFLFRCLWLLVSFTLSLWPLVGDKQSVFWSLDLFLYLVSTFVHKPEKHFFQGIYAVYANENDKAERQFVAAIKVRER